MSLVEEIIARIITGSLVAIAGVIVLCETGHPDLVGVVVPSVIASQAALGIMRYLKD